MFIAFRSGTFSSQLTEAIVLKYLYLLGVRKWEIFGENLYFEKYTQPFFHLRNPSVTAQTDFAKRVDSYDNLIFSYLFRTTGTALPNQISLEFIHNLVPVSYPVSVVAIRVAYILL